MERENLQVSATTYFTPERLSRYILLKLCFMSDSFQTRRVWLSEFFQNNIHYSGGIVAI